MRRRPRLRHRLRVTVTAGLLLSLSLSLSLSCFASSASSTAAAAESDPRFTSGVMVMPPCDYDCDQFSRYPIGADLTNGQYFVACGGTSKCGSNQLGTQYTCCAQACKVDNDCPSSYHCPGGAIANSYRTRCLSCSSSTSAKCQADQQSKYPCCLNAAGNSCYSQSAADSTTTGSFSAETCCPSSSSSYMFDTRTNSCSCGIIQSCPGLPSSSPSSPSGLPSPPPPPPAVSSRHHVDIMTFDSVSVLSALLLTQCTSQGQYAVCAFDASNSDC